MLRPLPSPTVHLKIGVWAVPPRALWDLPGLRLNAGAATAAVLDLSWTRFRSLFGVCGDRLLVTCPLCRGRHFLIGSVGGRGGDPVAPEDLPRDGGCVAWGRRRGFGGDLFAL